MKRIFFLTAVLFFGVNTFCQKANITQPKTNKKFTLVYGNSAYADFLYYLMYRSTNKYISLDSLIKLNDIPEYTATINTLAEKVNALQIKSYKQIYQFLPAYKNAKNSVIEKPVLNQITYGDPLPNYDTLSMIIHGGEKYFKKFQIFWKDSIQQTELNTIAKWKEQNRQLDVPNKLFALLRIQPKFDTLFVGAIALHLAGSGLLNPPSVHSMLFKKPNLAWFLGHELTHLLVGEYTGASWQKDVRFSKIMKYLKDNNINNGDVEEALCSFNQVKLSQICGLTEQDYNISKNWSDDNSLKAKTIRELDKNYNLYETDLVKFPTELDYLRWCVEKVISE